LSCFKTSCSEGGKALLLATHNPGIAEACDWIHEMKDGRITASHRAAREVRFLSSCSTSRSASLFHGIE
jgi:ABC-type lipoprotein export system ATPase subunit